MSSIAHKEEIIINVEEWYIFYDMQEAITYGVHSNLTTELMIHHLLLRKIFGALSMVEN